MVARDQQALAAKEKEIGVNCELMDEVAKVVEDLMSDTLIAQVDIVEGSSPASTENEQQSQEMMLALANAKYHEPI